MKDDEELREASDENRKKAEYSIAHFDRLNALLRERGRSTQYLFKFLTPKSFNAFFASLRAGKIAEYRSDLDVKLAENSPDGNRLRLLAQLSTSTRRSPAGPR